MDRKIVITGGAGFIGSHITEMHKRLGDHIVVIDNLSTSKQIIPDDKVDFIHADLGLPEGDFLRDYLDVEKELSEADLVYHMASSVGVKHVDKDPKGSLRNSFNINNRLFPLFEHYSNRVIFASSSEVYGNTEEARETDTLKIGSPDTLRWGYACGKLMSEFLLKTYNFPSTIVRFFNVTGKGQVSDHGMVLPTFIEKALLDEDIIVYGDGEQYRTFCDIRDAVEMLNILSNDEHIGEIYNIGNSNNTITITQLAEEVVATVGSDSKIVYRNYEKDFSKDFGEIYKRKPNTDKIDRYYKAKHTVEDIIESML
jgi:UDP-glucose 4-epimerase